MAEEWADDEENRRDDGDDPGYIPNDQVEASDAENERVLQIGPDNAISGSDDEMEQIIEKATWVVSVHREAVITLPVREKGKPRPTENIRVHIHKIFKKIRTGPSRQFRSLSSVGIQRPHNSKNADIE